MARSRKKGGAQYPGKSQTTIHPFKDESDTLRDVYHNDANPCCLALEKICSNIFPASLLVNLTHSSGHNTPKAHQDVYESPTLHQAVLSHLLEMRKRELDPPQSTHIMPKDQVNVQLDLILQNASEDRPFVPNRTLTQFFEYLHQRYTKRANNSHDPHLIPTIYLADIYHAVLQIDCDLCRDGVNFFLSLLGNGNGALYTASTSSLSLSPTSLSSSSPNTSLSSPSSSLETSRLMFCESSYESPMPNHLSTVQNSTNSLNGHKYFFMDIAPPSHGATTDTESDEDFDGLLFEVIEFDGKNGLVIVPYVFNEEDGNPTPTYLQHYPITLEGFIKWIRHTVLAYGLQPLVPVNDDDSSCASGGRKRFSSILSTYLYQWFQKEYLSFKADASAEELLGSISPGFSSVMMKSKKKQNKRKKTRKVKEIVPTADDVHVSDEEHSAPLNLADTKFNLQEGQQYDAAADDVRHVEDENQEYDGVADDAHHVENYPYYYDGTVGVIDGDTIISARDYLIARYDEILLSSPYVLHL